VPQTLSVSILRELFRNLVAFRNLHEDTGQDVISDPRFGEWCLHDLEYLYVEGLPLLPPRQAEAIELCLVQQYKEREAALMMGVKVTNPVAAYAADGLANLIRMIERGDLPRFRVEEVA
jgi:DNA-directed RNA polymerase specialized sigma24 family protein